MEDRPPLTDRPPAPFDDAFFEEADAAIVHIEAAVRRHDAAAVAACAERLAATAAAAGARLIAPVAAELQERAQAHDLGVAAHLLAALEHALIETRVGLALAASAPAENVGGEDVEASSCRREPALDVATATPGRVMATTTPPAVTPAGAIALRPLARLPQPSAWMIPAAAAALCVAIAYAFSSSDLGGIAAYAAAGLLALVLACVGRTVVREAQSAGVLELRSLARRHGDARPGLLFERNPQPLWVYDRRTLRIVAVSNAALAAYGYTREEFLAMRATDLRAPEDVPSLLEFLETADGKERLGFCALQPWRHRRKDGTVVDVEIASDDLIFDGRECRIVLSQDVTERNRAVAELALARDQAVEASNLKSAFLANISHEIRTPMQGVIGMNELLLDSGLDADQLSYARQLSRCSEQMLAVIDDILDIEKIESGRLAPQIQRVALREVLERACAPARAQAEAKRLRFELRCGEDVPREFSCDGELLARAVAKLVSNAVEFAESGSVRVRVGARRGAAGEELARIEVSDTGVGIEPGSLEGMFEPFRQGDGSITRRHGGLGLGLAIARELIELMGGTIGAESEPGRGSTFWFELSAPAHDAGSRDGSAAVAAAAPPLVLVAEDSHVNQVAAVRALARCGCRADVVADGSQALAALSSKRYDAVLMDCHMPTLDGYEATARLRRRERDRHTPVIAMTACEMSGDGERCLGAGMDAYISKPLAHRALTECLSRWVPGVGGCSGSVLHLDATRRF